MIFSELYSAYYNAVACILRDVLNGETREEVLRDAVSRHAFSESVLTVLPALKSEKWQLLKHDFSTPLQRVPSMPMTTLEKQWLKAILLDPRIRLFDISLPELKDTEPLFTSEDYILYDQYSDGDPFEDPEYIDRFRIILQAIREHHALTVKSYNRKGQIVQMHLLPRYLEYSEKDNKFRLFSSGCRYGGTVNLSRIISCERYYSDFPLSKLWKPQKQKETVTLRISDERNALERCMLHFSHFQKQTERIDGSHYLMKIQYDRDDETELVIRVLGFGPLIEVLHPDSFLSLIKERLIQQKSCGHL